MTAECESQVPKGITPEEWHMICAYRRKKEEASWFNKGIFAAVGILESLAAKGSSADSACLRAASKAIQQQLEVPSALS